MKWLVVAPRDGIGITRIVADTSWSGWPKAKSATGQVLTETWGNTSLPLYRMAGKTVMQVVDESPDGKSIPETAVPKPMPRRPPVAPPEVQEVIARKLVDAPNAVQEEELVEQEAEAVGGQATVVDKPKRGRPPKAK